MRLVTHSGEILNLLGEIRIGIKDIAWALSKLTRYTGHTEPFYSVAQHSVLVAELCPKSLRFQGLLHDAHESVTADISSPVKEVLEHLAPGVWSNFEGGIASQIRTYYQIPKVLNPAVKQAENRLLQYEIAYLFTSPARKAWKSLGHAPDFSKEIAALSPDAAYRQFMEAYHRYGLGVGL